MLNRDLQILKLRRLRVPDFLSTKKMRVREPGSFLRENAVAFVTLLRVSECRECRSSGNKYERHERLLKISATNTGRFATLQ